MMEHILRILGLSHPPEPTHVKEFKKSRRRLERAEADGHDEFSRMMSGMATKDPPASKRQRATRRAGA